MTQHSPQSQESSHIPTQEYDVSLHKINFYADKVARNIALLIKMRKIDPQKLVVEIGEEHDKMAHHAFEKSFFYALQQHTGIGQVFDEVPASKEQAILASKVDNDIEATTRNINNTGQTYVHSSTCAAILSSNTPYHAIDMEFDRKIQGQTVIAENIPATSELGLIHRNRNAASKIDNNMQENPGIGLSFVGNYHIADPSHPNSITQPEMLLHMGYDVVTISLHTVHEEDPENVMLDIFKQEHENLCARLPEEQRSHYRKHFDLVIEPMDQKPASNQELIEMWDNLENRQTTAPEPKSGRKMRPGA
jgi:hypothetical protein